MATRIADICEPGNSIRASAAPFWKWRVIAPCQFAKPRSGLTKMVTVYYLAAKNKKVIFSKKEIKVVLI